MPSFDFIDDAVDLLERDPNLRFYLICAFPKDPRHTTFAHLRSRRAVSWLRARINDDLDKILVALPPDSPDNHEGNPTTGQ